LLGVHVDIEQRATTVRFPHDMSHYRSSLSQGSDVALTSAFAEHLLMVLRYARPKSLVIPQLQDLCVMAFRSGLQRRTVAHQLWRWAAKIRNNTGHDQRTSSWTVSQLLTPVVLDECGLWKLMQQRLRFHFSCISSVHLPFMASGAKPKHPGCGYGWLQSFVNVAKAEWQASLDSTDLCLTCFLQSPPPCWCSVLVCS